MSQPSRGFSALDLSEPVVRAVSDLGFEAPLPVQAECIPHLLAGRDVLGLAQTGTGKTAAFALPLLSRLDPELRAPQVLVLTPTRELAIQVADAFRSFGAHLPGLGVAVIYGGQNYSLQFKHLRRGPQVVVGTPGRVIDHLEKGTLDLGAVSAVVLDEADEMLKMGFVEDVETILEQAPAERQTALFSATMPAAIRRICDETLDDPAVVRIAPQTVTADNIEQGYLVLPESARFEALLRLLEAGDEDGVLVFVRTRAATVELAERLAARGVPAEALNGEMTQKDRERTVRRFRAGEVDLLVATDVAARGLDVERVTLVVNMDPPRDPEAYVHRIGRTGRVGRHGRAVLFVGPRERGRLLTIERATRRRLEPLELPDAESVTRRRIERFRDELAAAADSGELDFYRDLTFELMDELEVDALELSAWLLALARKDRPLQAREHRGLRSRAWDDPMPAKVRPGQRERRRRAQDLVLYRIEVGASDGVQVRNIVGAITNETGLRGDAIGRVSIHHEYSTVELPDGMPRHVAEHLKRARVGRKPMRLAPVGR